MSDNPDGTTRPVHDPGAVDPGFAVAIDAFVTALDGRLAPEGHGFADLFTTDAELEVPFDGAGDNPAVTGRAAIAQMAVSLRGVLRFDAVHVDRVITGEEGIVVCEYEALLHRFDLNTSYRRRYVALIELEHGLIRRMREYGGPFIAV